MVLWEEEGTNRVVRARALVVDKLASAIVTGEKRAMFSFTAGCICSWMDRGKTGS